jgi:hypothetical protein
LVILRKKIKSQSPHNTVPSGPRPKTNSPRLAPPSHVPVTTDFDYVYLVLLGQSKPFPLDKTSETLQENEKNVNGLG